MSKIDCFVNVRLKKQVTNFGIRIKGMSPHFEGDFAVAQDVCLGYVMYGGFKTDIFIKL